MTTRANLLDVHELSVRFDLRNAQLHAVRGISFTIDRGEILALVGESGCGKSATSLALMDLLPSVAHRSARALNLNEVDLLTVGASAYSDLRGNKIAMIFQEPMTALNPVISIGKQLVEPLMRHRKVKRAEATERALHLLEKVGLPDPPLRLRQYPHELSGGMRQRVVIAMALMCDPDLVIADEPTTALDATTQFQILTLLSDLCRELQMGMLLITHDLGVVRKTAARTAVMYAGEIVEMGRTDEVLSQPRHPYTQRLLSSLPGSQPPGSMLETIPGVVPSIIGDLDRCGFADRCPLVFDDCLESAVALRGASDGHRYRCLLPEGVA